MTPFFYEIREPDEKLALTDDTWWTGLSIRKKNLATQISRMTLVTEQ
jgi:hypothetical protein